MGQLVPALERDAFGVGNAVEHLFGDAPIGQSDRARIGQFCTSAMVGAGRGTKRFLRLRSVRLDASDFFSNPSMQPGTSVTLWTGDIGNTFGKSPDSVGNPGLQFGLGQGHCNLLLRRLGQASSQTWEGQSGRRLPDARTHRARTLFFRLGSRDLEAAVTAGEGVFCCVDISWLSGSVLKRASRSFSRCPGPTSGRGSRSGPS